MTLEKVTLKDVKVTINFDIDRDTLKHYLETKEADKDDIMAIYDMICTHFARLHEQGEPQNIRAYFDVNPETLHLIEEEIRNDNDHPHLRRIK
jgi:hypothetical protein